jgi:hypothetical protein
MFKKQIDRCNGPHKKVPGPPRRETEEGKGREIYQVDTWKCANRTVKDASCTELIVEKKLIRDKNGKVLG